MPQAQLIRLSYKEIGDLFQNAPEVVITVNDRTTARMGDVVVSISDLIRACNYWGLPYDRFLNYLVAANSPCLTLEDSEKLSRMMGEEKRVILIIHPV